MEVINTSTRIPTDQEIQDLKNKVREMEAKREEAKQILLQAFKSGEVINALSTNEAATLMRQLQAKFQGARRKVRGSPVSQELRMSLEEALKQGEYTLSQLERMFGLSVSYISRIKGDLRKKGSLPPFEGEVKNAYDKRSVGVQSA